MKHRYTGYVLMIAVLISACSTQKKAAVKSAWSFENAASSLVINDSNLLTAHIGISIYNPAENKYLYNYQGDKYFVPASNVKLFTCYAAMKNLGDSLVGLRYKNSGGDYLIQATGDPTFLHKDFKNHPVFNFLKSKPTLSLSTNNWHEKPLGFGWAWDDYNSDYMCERSPFPIFGNVVRFLKEAKGNAIKVLPSKFDSLIFNKKLFRINDSVQIQREFAENEFSVSKGASKFKSLEIPFVTHNFNVPLVLLNDTLKLRWPISEVSNWQEFPRTSNIVYSQPTDSLLTPMMHRSDNFFAEQTLLMISNEKLGVMNDERIIDTLLKTDFKGLPQKPKWVDGSGLSRYNLITPQDFTWVLTQMKNNFSWKRITTILATGNEGTLTNYYKDLQGKLFAKTGTLSNQVALSGYLITKQNKTLVFSVLVNNHQTSATLVRRAVEKFLMGVYENN